MRAAHFVAEQQVLPAVFGDVGTDVMCYLRDTAGPYTQDDTIRHFETFVSIRNTRRRGRHRDVGVAHQDRDPKPR